MPDKVQTIWAQFDKKGRIIDISLSQRTSCRKIKVRYHTANKRGMGRSKGNSHERETARILSRWIFGKENPKHLKRTPLSGGWSSSKMGDVCIDPEIARQHNLKDPPMYVECRNYKDVLQYNVLSWTVWRSPKIYCKWIKEVETKCDGRLPLLVIKGKGTHAWIMILRRWLPSNLLWYAARLNTKRYGAVYMLPLTRVRSLGDGREFFERWVRDGGPAQLRRLVKGS